MTEQIRIPVTQADLQKLETDEMWIEVEGGEIIEVKRDMTIFHVLIIQNLFRILDTYVRANTLGYVFIDGLRYILEGTLDDIQRAYVPDLSFIRGERIPKDIEWNGDFPGVPDFAVEVASPEQSNVLLINKVGRYLEAGCEEAWLIYPWRQEVFQYRRDADHPVVYVGEDVIVTSELFPGLEIGISSLFETL